MPDLTVEELKIMAGADPTLENVEYLFEHTDGSECRIHTSVKPSGRAAMLRSIAAKLVQVAEEMDV